MGALAVAVGTNDLALGDLRLDAPVALAPSLCEVELFEFGVEVVKVHDVGRIADSAVCAGHVFSLSDDLIALVLHL